MAVPKVRTSRSRRNTRRAHHFLRPRGYSPCPNCQAVRLPHCVCLSCGYYRGRQVMAAEAKAKTEADNFEQPS